MAANPCCSCEIKVGCIVMVSIFMVFIVISLIINGISLGEGYDILTNMGRDRVVRLTPEGILSMKLKIGFELVYLAMCILVLIGAIKGIVGLIAVWYAKLVFFLLFSIDLFYWNPLVISIPVFIIGLLIVGYFLWVAQALINKIKADKRNPSPNAQGFDQLQPMQYGYPPPGQSPSAQYQQQGQQPPPMYGPGGQQPKMYGPGGQQPPMYGQGGQQPPQGTEY